MNSYDLERRDEAWDQLDAFRMQRDGYLIRPITRTLPPTAGTAEDADARGPQPHPAAGGLRTDASRGKDARGGESC